MSARYLVGDVRAALGSLEPGSVDLVMSSPPFLAQRDYLPAEHPEKANEIGSESTPGEFLDVLLDVVEACARVLAPHGSLVFELGDTYAGQDSRSGDGGVDPKWAGRDGFRVSRSKAGGAWPLNKSKAMIPELFAVALAYGLNPLTRRETDRWIVRNVVAWCKPNPAVGNDGDKFRVASSRLTVATKSGSRFWDGDAVRVPYSDTSHPRTAAGAGTVEKRGKTDPAGHRHTLKDQNNVGAGRPMYDWWEIPGEPYAGSHYATYPRALVVPVVASMCPARVCLVCGAPSRRITRTVNALGEAVQRAAHHDDPDGAGDGRVGVRDINEAPDYSIRETIGWTDCGHDSWRRGLVLDPFAGTGTTLSVATGHGFDAIGVDLDERNVDLALGRVGPMFLTVETLEREVL